MNRLLFLILLFFQGVTLNLYAQDTNKKPNFVIILADDLGYADVGFNGSKQIRTPNIDALAEQGVQCTQAYVSAPVCGPSRAGLITGRNQVNFGFDNNPIVDLPQFDENYVGVPVEEVTIADRLATLGYTNGLIGKWHLGEADQFHPTKRGFHEFWGYRGGGHNYFPTKKNGKGYPYKIESNFKAPQPITYITDDKGDECVDFIKRHKKDPFFLFASFNAPHAPMQATDADLALYEDIKDEKRRTYAAMIHRLDVNVGRIIKELKKQKVYDNTVIVFFSDNGGPCDHNASINAPYNGQKGILLEGGIRVPFVISYPKHLKSGHYDLPVSSLDLVPTFVDLAGGETTKKDKLDGVNIYPYITKKRQGNPHETMMWRFTISAGIRKGNWKLIRLPDRLPLLFNIDKDPSEQNDVAAENRDLVIEMLKELGDWDISCPQMLYMEGNRWRRNQVDLYDAEYQLTQPQSTSKKI
ncbi:sulfatase-like hydrolase/transferase [Flammeovirga kamogawensis]|uniref:Sulfatase-like hydrolase/transferase n=1 Tax=Flammeovirga kamogawensis TaxID=373891 RepID=A0ABX8H3A2_9BACT|nr:sulfatase-like hydrolase/transferase [Flammeovirga kamogawensis]MBB6460495.1 arylsulfatase A-like enzyme [Flammeovirga kamogawensis]QWG10301.1 sulfatase-like hydrolase/transferase [Flammeovirga kamogawensis]TRX64749.1 sulfatase-like hydrolase/transferase [Flammeovirga kamogawensis]